MGVQGTLVVEVLWLLFGVECCWFLRDLEEVGEDWDVVGLNSSG